MQFAGAAMTMQGSTTSLQSPPRAVPGWACRGRCCGGALPGLRCRLTLLLGHGAALVKANPACGAGAWELDLEDTSGFRGRLEMQFDFLTKDAGNARFIRVSGAAAGWGRRAAWACRVPRTGAGATPSAPGPRTDA